MLKSGRLAREHSVCSGVDSQEGSWKQEASPIYLRDPDHSVAKERVRNTTFVAFAKQFWRRWFVPAVFHDKSTLRDPLIALLHNACRNNSFVHF
jgi:hypothetical protein